MQRKISKFLGMLVALLIWLPGNSIAQDNMCRNLQRVNNLDEMLYQFYSNLDSDCLFTMPLADLEEAWGIKILSLERLQPGQELFELANSIDFEGKPYHSEIDAFYVQAFSSGNKTVGFSIFITTSYDQAHSTLFPDGNFPRLIPEPSQKLLMATHHVDLYSGEELSRPPQNPGVYSSEIYYYWLNTDKTRMISISPGLDRSVKSIHIFNENRLTLTE